MGGYDFQMDYLSGARNIIVDALSRASVCSFDPLAADTVHTLDNNMLRTEQRKDCHCILQWLLQKKIPAEW